MAQRVDDANAPRSGRSGDRSGDGGCPFRCSSCAFECVADYVGRTPPWNRSIVFIEEAYVVRDPLGDAAHPVCVGATCAACDKPVCAMPLCSLFYAKRICMTCARLPAVQQQLPAEILQAIAPASAAPADAAELG